MKLTPALLLLVVLLAQSAQATMSVGPWTPLFKGIDRAIGTNVPDGIYPRMQSVNCLRIDLSDPDVRLFTSPPVTNNPSATAETYAMSVSNFVKRYGVAVATVANFYDTSQGTSPSTEGIPAQVFGLLVTTGRVVSASDYGPDSNNRWASLLFTSNKEPAFAFNNAPPGTNTAGIDTAISGYFPVLVSGQPAIESQLRAAYPDPTFHDAQPRTLYGISEDNRYLYMAIIDGRQNGYSSGATSGEMGIWMQLLGAWTAICTDGGGSTSMYMQDCVGNPRPLGRSSYLNTVNPPRERITGAQFGVYAQPLSTFISDVAVAPGTTSATITWRTAESASTQVAYGLTTNLSTFSPFDGTLVTDHTVTLNGLRAGTRYYYKVISIADGVEHSTDCGTASFSTTNFGGGIAVQMTNRWRYSYANLDGINWTSPNFDDSGWSNGTACMWADTRTGSALIQSTNTIPNFAIGTRMPVNGAYPYTTYYFRTSFSFTNSVAGVTVTFSNYVDDGAVFYLNGVEIFRTNMPAGPISNGTYAPAGAPCTGNATCPLVFSFDASAVGLVTGTNVFAAEVHNFRSLSTQIPSPDLTFESAVLYYLPPPTDVPLFITNVVVAPGETNAIITWGTLSNSTTRVEYGTTPALGSSTPLNSNPVGNHAVVLTGLAPLTQYYFRVISTLGTNVFTEDGVFHTVPYVAPVFGFTKSWSYSTANLDGINWMARDYDDSAWTNGAGLLYIEENSDVSPRTSPLPFGINGLPSPTYYFRTRFTVNSPLEGLAFVFTNYVDDGAIFYLNGVEIQRLRMPAAPQPVSYGDLSAGCPPDNCEASADVPDIFRIGGSLLTNILVGAENVLAAEVHQTTTTSPDIVFGSALSIVRATAGETALSISQSSNRVCVSWPGANLKLQQASTLATNAWSDVPGASSPYCVTNSTGARYFRLRN